jgi:nicotinate-nucleotide pyrophosphorylase (carboxylating)
MSGRGRGVILAEEAGVLAGLPVAVEVLRAVDPEARLWAERADGDDMEPGAAIAEVAGSVASLLGAERVMLNFLQRLSGIATVTRRFVREVEGTGARILDTRKTTPLLRHVERYAVRVGGGVNHRFALDDGILIKDNHVVACGGVAEAVRRARAAAPPLCKVCVEVETLEELGEALGAGAHHVLLDNFPADLLAEAATRCRSAGVSSEASGGIRLETLAATAAAGVDFISAGALTHSARALGMKLDLAERP